MPSLVIDRKPVTVPEGETLLRAAQRAGIDIPTLCHMDGIEPQTSCMLCVVKDVGTGCMLPSCAAKAEDNMVIETGDDEVRVARQEILELLLSEHVGDCEAPCSHTCPASLNISLMTRQVATGDLDSAEQTVTESLVLPTTLGYVCPAPCENTCRRKPYDEPMSIKEIHRMVGERVIDADEKPDLPPDTGRQVCVIGAGPAGLGAAWVLRQRGHDCHVFEREAKPGGRLRKLPEEELPKTVLDAEIEIIRRLGAKFETSCEVDSIEEHVRRFDAVIVTCKGTQGYGENVFLGREHTLPVRAIANGKAAAETVVRFLKGLSPLTEKKPFESRVGRMENSEIKQLIGINTIPPSRKHQDDSEPLVFQRDEAARCLHCGCRMRIACKLRQFATEYDATGRKYRPSETRRVELIGRAGNVVFEPGKCIKCGLCIAITEQAGEELGLTFVGRGFDVRVAVPFNGTFEKGLKRTAEEAVAACPTGALAFRNTEDGNL